MIKLSEKQRSILNCIKRYIAENGRAPTLRELAEEYCITRQAAHWRLRGLVSKGYIATVDGSRRNIVVLDGKKRPTTQEPIKG
jgi:SOS-response transcriptional repressor LexA